MNEDEKKKFADIQLRILDECRARVYMASGITVDLNVFPQELLDRLWLEQQVLDDVEREEKVIQQTKELCELAVRDVIIENNPRVSQERIEDLLRPFGLAIDHIGKKGD